ncbi:MAG TPA: methionyl-tRNA formyltransferase [Vicinamibacterales bacterium]|nr:methionyl-tRNA formyltransferase [Vicinamibacterales bacterium]
MVTSDPIKVVFFGTPAFAVPTLDALLASRYPVVAVVTQPDRPRGRGQKVTDAPVKARARAAGLPVLQPDRLKDAAFSSALHALHADLGVVAAYGKILTDEVLAIPPLGMINVHASLLPKYRGAAPVHRAIINGERESGVTIMRVVKALDAGAMISKMARLIGPEETSDEVEQDLARIGAALLVRAIDDLVSGRAVETPQNDADATYAHRLTKEDGVVDWSASAQRIHDTIRGLHPWPHVSAYVDGKRLILHRSSLESGASPHPPGAIVEAEADRLVVATGDGLLRLTELQAEGKRPMGARAFLSGHHLKIGDRFTSAP